MILEIWVLDEGPFNGAGGAQLIFGPGVKVVGFRFEITRAQFAIAAKDVGMNTSYRGLFEHAFGGTVSAAKASVRIKLPNGFSPAGTLGQGSQ